MDLRVHYALSLPMISQTSEYALRAAVHLAQIGGGPSVAQDIAVATQVPLDYLHKILRMLSKEGILIAQRGSGGGFSLAKVPSAISVLDVLRASDTMIDRIEKCPLGIPGHTHLCAVHRLLDDAIAETARLFSGTSIADLINHEDSVVPLCDASAQGSQTKITTPASRKASTRKPKPKPGE